MSELPDRRWFDGLARFVRDIGFPVAVAAWLLWGLGPKIDSMTKAMNENSIVLLRVAAVLEARR